MISLSDKIRDVFEEKGVFYRENKRSFILSCPACGKEEKAWCDKTDKCRTKCFSCNTRWNWPWLLADLLGVSVDTVRSLVLEVDSGQHIEEGLPLLLDLDEDEEEPEPEQKRERIIRLPWDFRPIFESDRAIEYVLSRGVRPEQLVHFDLRYCTAMDAVVFPIRRDGEVYGWQSRTIPPTDKMPGRLRLNFSTPFEKAKHLLNIDRAKNSENILLVEGPFDCINADITECAAVASFGKAISSHQIKMLLDSRAKRIYVGLDPDAADLVDAVVQSLYRTKEVFRALPPRGKKDFGECSSDEVREALASAQECFGWPASRIEVFLK